MFWHVTCKKKMMKAVKIAWAWSYSGYFMQLYLLYNHKWKTHQKNCMLPRQVTRTTQQASTFLLHYFFYTENNRWKIQEVVHGYISMPRTIYTVWDSLSKTSGKERAKIKVIWIWASLSAANSSLKNCSHQFQPFLFSNKSLKNLFINKQLINYTEKNDILCQFQFGFRKGRSTEQAV